MEKQYSLISPNDTSCIHFKKIGLNINKIQTELNGEGLYSKQIIGKYGFVGLKIVPLFDSTKKASIKYDLEETDETCNQLLEEFKRNISRAIENFFLFYYSTAENPITLLVIVNKFKYHLVDSNPAAYEMATYMAITKAFETINVNDLVIKKGVFNFDVLPVKFIYLRKMSKILKPFKGEMKDFVEAVYLAEEVKIKITISVEQKELEAHTTILIFEENAVINQTNYRDGMIEAFNNFCFITYSINQNPILFSIRVLSINYEGKNCSPLDFELATYETLLKSVSH